MSSIKIIYLFTGLFAVIGLVMMARGARDVLRARRSANWPPARATIIESREVSGHENTTRPEVAFRYSVAGTDYVARTVYFGQGVSSGVGGHTARILRQYPVGAATTAYYDPLQPSLAVLEPGFRRSALCFVAFGWVFFAVGTGFFFLWWTVTPSTSAPDSAPVRHTAVGAPARSRAP